MFVGDVRNLRLLQAYHTSLELYKAATEISISELMQRVSRAAENEAELLVDEAFFHWLWRSSSKLATSNCCLKLENTITNLADSAMTY